MPITPSRMPFFDHIAELRRRIIIIAVTIIVGSMALYYWGWDIFDFVMAPITPLLNGDEVADIHARSARSACASRWRSTLRSWSAAPSSSGRSWRSSFRRSSPRSARYVIPTFIALVALFIVGVDLLLHGDPRAPRSRGSSRRAAASIGQTPDADQVLPRRHHDAARLRHRLRDCRSIVFYLVIFNIVPYAKLRSSWRVVYVVLMLVASAATPDWSPYTMGGLYVALVLLYEGSMLLARVDAPQAHRRAEARELAEDETTEPTTHPGGCTCTRWASRKASSRRRSTPPRRPARHASPRSASPSASSPRSRSSRCDFAFESLTPGTMAEGATLVVTHGGAQLPLPRVRPRVRSRPVPDALPRRAAASTSSRLTGRELRIDSIEADDGSDLLGEADADPAEETVETSEE